MSTQTPELIPILHTRNAAASVQWYAQLGFTQNWIHRFAPDLPAFVEISNGPMKIFLSEHAGDARPDTLIFFRVPDLDAFVANVEGGVEVEDSEEIGMRDCEVRDLDGNRIRVGTRLERRG